MSAADSMWADYVRATGAPEPHEIWAFAEEHPETADELAELVRIGVKRATTGLLADYEDAGDELPVQGMHIVVVDGSSNPACIAKVTGVRFSRFGEVDAEFAAIEGEGDGSLDYWRRAHIEFFGSIGYEIDEETELVLTTFEKVWPLET